MKTHSGFRTGTGCFKCESCGKLTRQVDTDLPYCQKCINEQELENSYNDGDCTKEEYELELKKIRRG